MVEPTVQEFGDAAIKVGALEKVKIMLEKYHHAKKTVNGDALKTRYNDVEELDDVVGTNI